MKILVATRNAHKLHEIGLILGPGFELLPVTAVPEIAEVVEDRLTIEGNAEKKAVEVSAQIAERRRADAPDLVLADDSGLEVDALDGAPGVHSAYYGQDEKRPDEHVYAANNRRLLRELEARGVRGKARSGRFKCVMTLARAGKVVASFTGLCPGIIINEAKGEHGFGYDPLFVPDGHCQTFAQLGDDVKNRISHRAKALEQMKTFLKDFQSTTTGGT